MSYTIGIDARKAHDFGIGTYVRGLVRALAEIDTENRYILFVGTKAVEAFENLPDNFRLVIERSPPYSFRELMALSWRIFSLDLDLYHATHYVLPAIVPCRAVVTIHDIIHLLYPEFLPNRLAFLYAQRMIRSSLSRGHRIIAVSENTRADLMAHFHVAGRKIQVVYNGVDPAYRVRLDPAERDRRLEPLGIQSPYLLFVGNPKPHKNLDRVLQAYARAVKLHGFSEPLICVGDRGTSDLKLRMRADALGVGDRVRFVGHVPGEALPAIYQGASLFLYPTLYEGFGLPVVEAMASGVPVVTSNTSALREIAEGYAQLVNPLDVEGMAEAIARCMAEPDFRQSLAERGSRREVDFRWERTARKTLAIYLGVLRRRERGASGRAERDPASEITSSVGPAPPTGERP